LNTAVFFIITYKIITRNRIPCGFATKKPNLLLVIIFDMGHLAEANFKVSRTPM